MIKIKDLPEDIRKKAIANATNSEYQLFSIALTVEDAMESALSESFLWEATPEGGKYWRIINNSYKKNEKSTN